MAPGKPLEERGQYPHEEPNDPKPRKPSRLPPVHPEKPKPGKVDPDPIGDAAPSEEPPQKGRKPGVE